MTKFTSSLDASFSFDTMLDFGINEWTLICLALMNYSLTLFYRILTGFLYASHV